MSNDFFVAPVARTVFTPGAAAPTPGTVGLLRPDRPSRRPLWLLIAGGLAVAAAIVTLLVMDQRHGRARASVSVARLFGHAAGSQLPIPIASSECATAMRAFHGISGPADVRAFMAACMTAHGPDGGVGGTGLTPADVEGD